MIYIIQISIIFYSLLFYNCLITRNASNAIYDILWYNIVLSSYWRYFHDILWSWIKTCNHTFTSAISEHWGPHPILDEKSNATIDIHIDFLHVISLSILWILGSFSYSDCWNCLTQIVQHISDFRDIHEMSVLLLLCLTLLILIKDCRMCHWLRFE